MEVIQELANQLGVAVENLLTAYAPFCLGSSIGTITASFVILVSSIIVVVLSLKSMMHNYRVLYDTHDKCPSEKPQVWVYGIIATVMMFVATISLICFVNNLPYLVGAIMSPQGAAIHRLIRMVTGN